MNIYLFIYLFSHLYSNWKKKKQTNRIRTTERLTTIRRKMGSKKEGIELSKGHNRCNLYHFRKWTKTELPSLACWWAALIEPNATVSSSQGLYDCLIANQGYMVIL